MPTLIRRHLATSLGLALVLAPPLSAQAPAEGDLGHVDGDPEAPVVVVEFSDFACEFCADFHDGGYTALRDAYITTGKVRWVYVTFASGQYANSFTASAVAECAAEHGQFEGMKGKLYAGQAEWTQETPEAAAQVFLAYVAELGIDRDSLLTCVSAEETSARLHRASDLAAQIGITATPTYVIDGFPIVGAQSADVIAEVLDARLEQLGIGAKGEDRSNP